MKTNNLNIEILILLLVVLASSCTNREAYNDGKWWAEECWKMVEDENYESPVTSQYMRMKAHTDDCEPSFYEGFKDYLVTKHTHQEDLTNQLKLMKKKCEDK